MKLFDPIRIRDVELKNRIAVSPMCQYSAKDGHPQTWHLVHLGSRAAGGASLVMAEATAVEARGRISPADTGIYEDSHIESWRPVAEFIRSQGGLPGIQLAHAGRKASVTPPRGGRPGNCTARRRVGAGRAQRHRLRRWLRYSGCAWDESYRRYCQGILARCGTSVGGRF